MKKLLLLAATFIVLLAFGLSCAGAEKGASSQKEVTGGDVKKEIGEAVDATQDLATQEWHKAVKEGQKGLDAVDKKITDLKKSAHEAKKETREKVNEEMKGLDKKRAESGEKLKQLKGSGKDSYREFKKGLDESLEDLSKAIDRALSKLRD